jgi:hypothetical protein
VAIVAPVVSLCPSCALREVDTVSGLCAPCVVERVAEAYAAADRRAVIVRVQSWTTRTTRPDAEVVKLRQRRHRLREMVRPHEPARSTDPWEIAAAALHDLRRVHSDPDAREAVSEALRRLAWGPQD